MGCPDNNCNDSNSISLTGSWFAGSPCVSTDCGGSEISANCVIYNGANLDCSGIETSDSLEVALQKIDTQICEIIGDYSLYNMNCLPTWWEAAITTQEDFVDAITAYACDIDDRFTAFTTVTYVANQIIIDDRLTALEEPEITCASASVTDSDTLQEVLEKYCVKFGEIDEALDISTVDWNNCLTVVGTPETLAEGFQLLADQICDVYDLITAGGILPTFNNYGSCIGGSSSDSLVTTIGLIKTRLCLVPTFDNDNLTSSCFDIPTTDSDLEGLLQNMLDGMDALQENYVTFDGGDFVVTATDGGDPCAGITVALATPLNEDRFVAVSAGDSSPSTLIVKIASAAGSVAVTNNADTTLNLEVSNGDKGDITVSSAGMVWTIDNDVVTFAKMQNINTGVLLGRSTASSGNTEEISVGSGLSLTSGVLSNSTVGKTLIGITSFTSSGTWTKPAGCTSVVVYTIGGGGGGGGALGAGAQASVSGGGGAGAFSINFITSGLGATVAVTVGVGGAGGVSSSNGSSGSNSSFGAFVTAIAGNGGVYLATGTSIALATSGAGGTSPSPSGTTITCGSGEDGDTGVRLSASVVLAGKGGSSLFGFSYSGGGNNIGAGGNGTSEIGTSSGVTGFDGGDGIVIVYEYS